MNTIEQEARKRSEIDYDEYVDWVVSNYDVDDIDDDVFEKAIKESIYEAYMGQLYLSDDEDIWLVEDYDILESDIKYGIIEKLNLEE